MLKCITYLQYLFDILIILHYTKYLKITQNNNYEIY
jgi:hypothetical protein